MELNLEERLAAYRVGIEKHFPVRAQPKILTMAKKVAIEVAMPGWQPKEWYTERGVNNLPPITIKEQADAIVECVKAGAAVVHTHPRDPDTSLPLMPHPPEMVERHGKILAEVMDKAFEKVDFVTAHHTWAWDFSKSMVADYFTDTKNLLELGKANGVGNRYVQTAMIMTMAGYSETMPLFTEEATREGAKWFEDNGIKPMYSVESSALPMLKTNVFDTGISTWKPYWIAMQEGKHSDDRLFGDPWSYLEVITTIGLVRDAFGDDAFIGIHPAGRNWLAAATIALLYGVELVRVGIEDQFYLYPHKDDISKRASDTTEIVVTIAKALGREIATPEDVRQRTGIKLT
ncbi:3-keto-5-aminohexanoate cleavage protein [Chloroflexota bacterium]